MFKRLTFLVVLTASISTAQAATIDWTPVSNIGNAADSTGFGAVSYAYSIGTYDVTNRQYAEFLNTKDPNGTNPLGLWNSNMANASWGGISLSGGNVPGTRYVLTPGRENHPVNYVTWYDAVRFANWMNNGQGSSSTESGSYTLLGGTPTPSNGLSVTRNSGASIFITSENEWYKAAYYNPATNSYFQYATSSNAVPTASAPTGLANHANFGNVVGAPTDVAAYSGTVSPYGVFDMSGNMSQWNESLIAVSARGVRGGNFFDNASTLPKSYRGLFEAVSVDASVGFRLVTFALVPEPSSFALAIVGLIVVVAWTWRRPTR